MHVQPRLNPLARSDFFPDQRGARPLVDGTVARGDLHADTYFYTGKVGNNPGNYMPFPVTKEVLERGRERFNIYCAPCHSPLGDGNGFIPSRGFSRKPPSYHIPRLQKAPLGYFYDVMSNGFGIMSDYSAQISPRDRWNIVAYIHALQLSQNATSGRHSRRTGCSIATAQVHWSRRLRRNPAHRCPCGEFQVRGPTMSAVTPHLDLTAPPVVRKISQRSLVIGGVFAVIAVVLAFVDPDKFYRAYLLGFMCWLGVALGSMAILMIRHMTGGGWGTVIRRILGAAMRTLPLLAVLFIPIFVAVCAAANLSLGACRLSPSRICTSASISTSTASSESYLNF